MDRLPRRALALVAGLVLVASACTSSSATWPAGVAPMGGSGGPGGGTTAPGASAAVNPGDPSSIISAVIAGGPDTKSFHLKIEVNGTIKASGLSGLGGDTTSGLTGDLKLDGTTVEGDVDVANQAAHLAANISILSAGSTATIPADFIYKDGALYSKIDIPGLTSGSKYSKSSVGDLAGSLTGGAIAVPTAGPSGLSGLGDQVAQIRQTLDDAGAKATLVGVEKVGGLDAYHITISVPLDLLNSKIAGAVASAGTTAAAGLTIDSFGVDAWVYKADNRLAKIDIKAASSTIGNLEVVVTVTNYDKPVTITAPPASEVETPTP